MCKMARAKPETVVRALAALHIVGALGIVQFWIGFYSGVAFPRESSRRRSATV